MALSLEEAMHKLGELETTNKSLVSQVGTKDAEIETLRGHKGRLETDLGKTRNDKQDAEKERDALKGQLPDGSVVLSKADGARWGVLSGIATELGGVDKVQGRLARVTELEQASAKQERDDAIKGQGYDPKKLDRILGGAQFKVTGEGDEAKAFVTVDDKDTALSEWAEAEGVTDLLNVARLEPEETGARVVRQASRRDKVPVNTWSGAADDRFGKPKTKE